MLELSFVDTAKLAREGKSYDCSTCLPQIQKLRRCREDREDFTEKDRAFWPIRLFPGGEPYGFCPAKATWDPAISNLLRTLVVCMETGTLWTHGGVAQQPEWFMEIMGWLVPKYRETKFLSRLQTITGLFKTTGGGNTKFTQARRRK